VTVTNHSGKPSDYFIEAQVLDAHGVVIDTGNTLSTNLAPSQTARQELNLTVSQDKNPASLRISKVQRTAS
jgi:hypothetical protein